LNNEYHGSGTRIWPGKYEGEWENDQRNDQGEFTWNGRVQKVGFKTTYIEAHNNDKYIYILLTFHFFNVISQIVNFY
jgi:hypothetical protein